MLNIRNLIPTAILATAVCMTTAIAMAAPSVSTLSVQTDSTNYEQGQGEISISVTNNTDDLINFPSSAAWHIEDLNDNDIYVPLGATLVPSLQPGQTEIIGTWDQIGDNGETVDAGAYRVVVDFISPLAVDFAIDQPAVPVTITKFESDISDVFENDPIILSWDVTGATICTASDAWTGNKPVGNGNQESVVALPNPHNTPSIVRSYTLTCENGPNIDSMTIDVTVYESNNNTLDVQTPWGTACNVNVAVGPCANSRSALPNPGSYGFVFRPLVDGRVTGLGGNYQGVGTISLWEQQADSSWTLLGSATVQSNSDAGSRAWTYSDIPDIQVKSGVLYTVGLVNLVPASSSASTNAYTRYVHFPSWRTTPLGDILIEGGRFGNVNQRPNLGLTSYYMRGEVDIKFVPDEVSIQ